MVSVIVATFPVYGETVPLLQIARGMVERGHDVTVVAGSRFRADALSTGARFVPLSGAADYDDRRLDEIFPERAGRAGLDQNNFDTSYVLGDAIPDQYRLVQLLLQENSDQVVISNSGFLGMWPIALGAPGVRPRRWVAIGANPLYLSSADTTAFGPLPGAPSNDVRAATRAANAKLAEALRPSTDHLQEVLNSVGCTETIPTCSDAAVRVPEVFAELSIPECDFPRSDAPGSMHFVGILPAQRSADWSPPAWWADLDDERAVVVVTQGTLANNDLSELIEPTIIGLADSDVLVVAALGRDVDTLGVDVPANVRVAAYVPFDALLPRVDLFITNGGFGSTQQALAAGVPVVIAGTTEEKPLTAARVAAHGVGMNLQTSTPTPTQIADAAMSVLGDSSFRANAARLATAYARYDALDLIEALAIP